MFKVSVGCLKIGPKERRAVNAVLDSGRLSEGQRVFEFEKKWADFIGVRHCVATSSGTAALITSLTALRYLHKLDKRPKVITSPLTYISDVNAIVLSGFEPVFVDVDLHTFSIIPKQIEGYLKTAKDLNRHSIILPVDLMGFSVEIEKIKKIAQKYNLFILEDAAQAHGSIYKGKKCGAQADISVFSFYIAHNIQAGEMGAVATDSYDIYRLVKKIKTNGRYCECEICTRGMGICPGLQSYTGEDDFDPRFTHDFIGYNFKAMELTAAIALTQLESIKTIIRKRQQAVKYLNKGLRCLSRLLQLPIYSQEVSYLAYPLVIKDAGVISRRELRMELEKNGIETRPLFSCIPEQQPAYCYLKDLYKNKLPNAQFLGKNGFYIGCHQYLTRKDLDHIIEVLRSIGKKL